jgi:hypothetical protein
MQQILKWAGGGQPFLDQGQGVLLLTAAQNVGVTVASGIANFKIQKAPATQFRCSRGTVHRTGHVQHSEQYPHGCRRGLILQEKNHDAA